MRTVFRARRIVSGIVESVCAVAHTALLRPQGLRGSRCHIRLCQTLMHVKRTGTQPFPSRFRNFLTILALIGSPQTLSFLE
jgi:hypothetical protein